MTAIDAGPGAIDRASYMYEDYTLVDYNNAANASGYINYAELWFVTGVLTYTLYIATLYWNPATSKYGTRDYFNIGTVSPGSKQTFSGFLLDVTIGDYAGVYYPVGYTIEWSTSGYSGGVSYKYGQWLGTGEQTYTDAATRACSIYYTGYSFWANILKINAMLCTSILKINDVPIVTISQVNGVST